MTFPHFVAMVLVGGAWRPSQKGANAVNAQHFMACTGSFQLISTIWIHLVQDPEDWNAGAVAGAVPAVGTIAYE